jgi:exopolyphosphatase/guanosine-5'-triphosphate,3'-diphosphate pyrophosphatase
VTRVAVVDLGSNSTRLLVADVDEAGTMHEVDRRIEITKLAEGVDAAGRLAGAAVERVLACLETYRGAVDRLAPERTVAYATSAVRDAADGRRLLEAVEERFGFETRLLSGEDEARLTFEGIASGRPLPDPTVAVDVGGGSTEIVVGGADGIRFHTSLPLGCVRLAERFPSEDGIGSCDREALVGHVRRLLMDAVPFDAPPALGIGTAGTVTTLGTLHLGLDREDPARLHGHRLPAGWLTTEAHRLARTPVDELCRTPGIEPGRAAVIGAGALALAEIVGFFELDELEISERDVLHGMASLVARETLHPR